MSLVVFDPWVGSKYKSDNRFGVRVLVLGESHYGITPTSDFTIGVIERELDKNTGKHRFFTKISKVLLNVGTEKGISKEERAEPWDHIAFYNYIDPVPKSPLFHPLRNRGDF